MNSRSYSKIRRTILWVTILSVISLVVYVAVQLILNEALPRQRVVVGSAVFNAEVVSSDEDRHRGLSGRTNLGKGEAMLFDFKADSKWSMWMKDMNFPIDIVWINKSGRVVHVEHSVHPETYPERSFLPPEPSRYVLEIPAGEAKESGIRPGISANFKLLEENA